MPDIFGTIIRSILLIIGLFVITKLLGKKQLSSLSFFEYIVGITVGDIAGTLSMDPDLSLRDGIASLIIWSFVPFAISLISLRSRAFRRIVEGKSTTFIEHGNIIEKNMRNEKYSLDELLEQLRKKSVFKVADVEFASLDSNGELSVLLKKEKQPLKYEDISHMTEDDNVPVTLIMDGEIIKENLEKAKLDKKQAVKLIKDKGYEQDNVFYAEIDTNGDINIDLYDEYLRSHFPDFDQI
ncbi:MULTISPECIES: DUF421 domain-containing protein [unclassified Mesobacillus]|jgi:uncharacterized membrane protein YcaP (DUF421 family)|uniref:DUF421 domain-containing protein n=1 Tax=unclassified Mesobacillus TaxID=2675270 RepID=UPI002040ADD0|nr:MULTISPECIES: DUF421 domain-containing protein [unclassified Mesobacillus]MCM3124814.1 DUF421 domain-containing protein [Mesobacillus sp. MER 33]MCM3232877.1 DUF421 domain-containing protein [Mesobacillus sp. MER 48]